MQNLFDSANYPTSEPVEMVAGDRWAWKDSATGTAYSTASHTLSYSLRREETGHEITITATASGTDYLIEVASTVTTGYPSGQYYWQKYITRTSDSARISIASGILKVLPNRDTDTTDPRTHARKVLSAIEAVIEGRSTRDQEEYRIAGRMLRRTPLKELLDMRNYYAAKVRAEESIAGGQKNGNVKVVL